jgi:transposase
VTASNQLDETAKLRARVAELEQQVAHLTKQLFARKSERLADDKHPKLPLVWDEPEPPPPPHVEEAPDEEFEEITYKRKKRGATRISKDLPRETITIALPEDERRCPCCNEVMCKIGEEVSERLDYTPAVLKVIETRREKYACKQHEESGVLTPPVPIHPIEKGMATSGLLAHVLVAKYKDHLPLYRQSSIFARHGAEIAESTLCDWVKDAADLLQPVVLAMKTSVLASHVVQSDDTGITVLDKDATHGSRHSFLWAYVGDRDEVVFDFTAGRGRDGPKVFLGDFRGHLQVDAYAGYDAVLRQNGITASRLLGPCAASLLQGPRSRPGRGERDGSDAADLPRRTRSTRAGLRCRSTPRSAAARGETVARGDAAVARGHSPEALAQEPDGRRDQLHASAVGHARALPRRRSARDRQQPRRATDAQRRRRPQELDVCRLGRRGLVAPRRLTPWWARVACSASSPGPT